MNQTDLDGCTCFNHPPCGFCVNTFECEMCGDRQYAEGNQETEIGLVCSSCIEILEIK